MLRTAADEAIPCGGEVCGRCEYIPRNGGVESCRCYRGYGGGGGGGYHDGWRLRKDRSLRAMTLISPTRPVLYSPSASRPKPLLLFAHSVFVCFVINRAIHTVHFRPLSFRLRVVPPPPSAQACPVIKREHQGNRKWEPKRTLPPKFLSVFRGGREGGRSSSSCLRSSSVSLRSWSSHANASLCASSSTWPETSLPTSVVEGKSRIAWGCIARR